MVISFLREASDRLSRLDVSRLDQLFALECGIRGGSASAGIAARLRPCTRDAAWRADNEWEIDAPHATELAQLICARVADGDDPPVLWVDRLSKACDLLARRTARLTVSDDPTLLATLIRGLGVANQRVPEALLTRAEASVDAVSDARVLAQLAEALAHHPSLRALADRAAMRTFSRAVDASAARAIARWWIAERWRDICGQILAVAPGTIEAARLESLSTPLGDDARALGMAIEVAGRGASDLVVQTSIERLASRQRRDRRLEGEVLAWRYLAAAAVCVVLLMNVPQMLGWLLPHIGNHAVGPDTEVPLGAVFAGGLFYFSCRAPLAAVAVWRGRDLGRLENALDLLAGLVGAAVGAIIFTH